jgi:hypothetical protein
MHDKWFVKHGSDEIQEIPPNTFLTVNVTSTRGTGGKSPVIDGYDFHKHRTNADGSTVYQCCEVGKQKCNIRANLKGNQLISITNVWFLLFITVYFLILA